MRVDFGTGDGAFAWRAARADPRSLWLGVDAAAEGLREVSHRAGRKPSRGGAPNALFGVLALDDAPGELEGLADALTVLLPWGSLLAAVARAEPGPLARLRRLCRPGAEVQFVFGYGDAEASPVRELALPPLDAPGLLEPKYFAAGFEVSARPFSRESVRGLGTTWAGRLAFSGHARRFVELAGRAR